MDKERRKTIWMALLLAAALAAWPGLALADAPFELDGNATSNDFPGDDWDLVNFGLGTPLAATGLIADRPEPAFAQFTGGGSKDMSDITNWRHRSGTPPAKDDLTNAYAAAYENPDNGHIIIVFGMDRYDTSGDAQLGFWFLQDDVRPLAGGTFNGAHVDGDILVLVNFSGGGDVPTIQVFRWQGSGPVSLGAGDQVECVNGFLPSGQNHCGITNAVNVTAPWPYENKDVGDTDEFPPAAFFEGGIDLTALGVSACFTQFLAESRSSTSITAVLKDFATPEEGFNFCEIDVTKSCANPTLNDTEDGIIYEITGKVTNTGIGQVFNVDLSDDPAADGVFQRVDCSDPSNVLGTFPFAGPLAADGEVCYKNTFTVPLNENGKDDTITATANTESDGTGADITDTASADCPLLQVNPDMTVTKSCISTIVDAGTQLVVQVNLCGDVCNTGDSTLNSVTVTDDKAGIVFGPASLARNTCQTFSGSYFPAEAASACASEIQFEDTVTATAVDILGNPVGPIFATANCELCPGTCSDSCVPGLKPLKLAR